MAYKGGRRDRAKLKYEPEYYTPSGAKNLSEKELRKEYSRLRSIAQKRLNRFEGTEWTDSQAYMQNVGQYKPLDEISSNAELRHLLSDVARFVTAKAGSVSGLEKQRREAVKQLNDRGYKFITRENFRQFGEFMEYARIVNLNRLYDSKRVADFYGAVIKKGMTEDEVKSAFRSWSKKQRKQKKIQNVNPRNSNNARGDLYK